MPRHIAFLVVIAALLGTIAGLTRMLADTALGIDPWEPRQPSR